MQPVTEKNMGSYTICIDSVLKSACPQARLGCFSFTLPSNMEGQALLQMIQQDLLPQMPQVLAERTVEEITNVKETIAAYLHLQSHLSGKSGRVWKQFADEEAMTLGLPLYDLQQAIMIASGFSVGCYDAHRLSGAMEWRLGGSEESVVDIDQKTLFLSNEPILCDRLGIIGSPAFDSARAGVNVHTKKVLLVVYSFSAFMHLEEVMMLIVVYLRTYFTCNDIEMWIAE